MFVRFLLIMLMGLQMVALNAQQLFHVTAVHREEVYAPGMQHTVSIEVENLDSVAHDLSMKLTLPENWSLITKGMVGELSGGERNLFLMSFFIPAMIKAEKFPIQLDLWEENELIQKNEIGIEVAEKHEIQTYNLSIPQFVKAGDLIESVFQIRNAGNVEEEIIITASGELDGPRIRIIAPDSTIEVRIYSKTSARQSFIRTVSSNLKVTMLSTGEVIYTNGISTAFPTRIERKDPYFRLPIMASLFVNNYWSTDELFTSVSGEIRGTGTLDTSGIHQLEFLFRAPNQANIPRFGTNDQYSVRYAYGKNTTLRLGDFSYQMNRLGYNGRYGFGGFLSHRIKQTEIAAFYAQPRLFAISKTPFYGIKATQYISNQFNVAYSRLNSDGVGGYYNWSNAGVDSSMNTVQSVQANYNDSKTTISSEVAISQADSLMDFAADLQVAQRIKFLQYRGFATVAGPYFLGAMSNSVRFGNNLSASWKKWSWGIGQSFSKIHERIDYFLLGARPYFENYFITSTYRFAKNQQLNIRLDQREREDQQEPKAYHYLENGMDLRYQFSNNKWTINYAGRVAITKNQLLHNDSARVSFGHYLNTHYRLRSGWSLRSNVNYLKTNRYGYSNIPRSYWTFSFGVNGRIGQSFGLNFTYNSGFSPEENYQQRDYLNGTLTWRFLRQHQLEARVNYFANQATNNAKEGYAFLVYRCNLGIPLKKVLSLGGVEGSVSAEDSTIQIDAIRILASGSTVRPDKNGLFSIENLPLGEQQIVVDQSSLPQDVVVAVPVPFMVVVGSKKKQSLNIPLTRPGGLNGQVVVSGQPIDRVQGFLKLSNNQFTYYTKLDDFGRYSFLGVVPGNYNLELMSIKSSTDIDKDSGTMEVILEAGITNQIDLKLEKAKRVIRMKSTQFNLGE